MRRTAGPSPSRGQETAPLPQTGQALVTSKPALPKRKPTVWPPGLCRDHKSGEAARWRGRPRNGPTPRPRWASGGWPRRARPAQPGHPLSGWPGRHDRAPAKPQSDGDMVGCGVERAWSSGERQWRCPAPTPDQVVAGLVVLAPRARKKPPPRPATGGMSAQGALQMREVSPRHGPVASAISATSRRRARRHRGIGGGLEMRATATVTSTSVSGTYGLDPGTVGSSRSRKSASRSAI